MKEEKHILFFFTYIIPPIGLLIGQLLNQELLCTIIGTCLGVLIDYIRYITGKTKVNISNQKLLYENLTYKKKFERTLISTPFIIIAIIIVLMENINLIYNIIAISIIIAVWVGQLLYNYKRIELKTN